MKKFSRVVWGAALIALGVIFALNALGVTDINVFFDGWWTLFIIIPCLTGLVTEKEKTGNLIGLLIGVFLLLCSQNVMSFSMLWKILLPAVVIIIGLKMVITGMFGNQANEMIAKLKKDGNEPKTGSATFSGCNLDYNGEKFDGAELSAVFGGVKCDLRKAVIEKDCAISATAVFGGVDILVPDDVNVKVSSNSIFGGVTNKTVTHKGKDMPTIYVSATCMLGGVEIK